MSLMNGSGQYRNRRAIDWDRKPARNHGKQPKCNPPQPEPGFISARCKVEGKCCECYALKCSCKCHTRGG